MLVSDVHVGSFASPETDERQGARVQRALVRRRSRRLPVMLLVPDMVAEDLGQPRADRVAQEVQAEVRIVLMATKLP